MTKRSPVDIDSLPNPYLHRFLDPDFTGMTKEALATVSERPLCYGFDFGKLSPAERKSVWPLHRAHLRAAHLPEDYDSLGDIAQKLARFCVYESWYDKAKPGELVSSVPNAVASMYLWNEHIEKASVRGRSKYHMRDLKVKYDVVAAALSPPLVPTEPAKTAFHVVRGGTKTTTLIRQLPKMLTTTRPNTGVLVCEVNDDRTKEETKAILTDFEENELIHADFGGKGVLFPKRSTPRSRWSLNHMDLIHYPECYIMGYSMKGAQLGRHPLIILLDDIEDPDKAKTGGMEYRREIFNRILKVFKFMLYRGGKLVVFGNARPGSCLEVMTADRANQGLSQIADSRFDDFRKLRFDMIVTNEKGESESMMPDHMSVAGYNAAKLAVGAHVVGSEIDGVDVQEGASVLRRHPFTHGYMHAFRELPGGIFEEYMLDLMTWKELPWQQFLDSLETAAAVDIADSQEPDSDYGCFACVGSDSRFVKYVLDICLAKLGADEWPVTAYGKAMAWNCPTIGWETAALQKVICRLAQRLEQELQEQGHLEVPHSIPLANSGRNKHLRIISTLGSEMRKTLLRFPRWTPVQGPDGQMHYPVACESANHWSELFRQIDNYTSEGLRGHDDAADALQMAIRTLGWRKGKDGEVVDPILEDIERWERRGVELPAYLLPPGYRKDPVELELNARTAKVGGSYFEMDPYD